MSNGYDALDDTIDKLRDENKRLKSELAAATAAIRGNVSEIARLAGEVAANKSKTYCAYCGYIVPVDDDAATAISEHIKACDKHPLQTLAGAVDKLASERDSLREGLRRLEFVQSNFGSDECPSCLYSRDTVKSVGHRKDCWLAALLEGK